MQKPLGEKESGKKSKKPAIKRTQLGTLLDHLSVKAALVKCYLDQGRSFREIRTLTGASNNLIQAVKSGKRNVPVALIENLKKGLITKSTIASDKFLSAAMTDEKIGKASLSQLMVGFGISVEKARLLSNESTHNIDVRSVHAQIGAKMEELETMLAENNAEEESGAEDFS